MNAIVLENLDIVVAEKCLVHQLNARFNAGEVWGVFGPNGAGKTTLLHAMAGLFAPSQGSILLCGKDINQLQCKQRAQQVGVLLQDIEFSFPSTVLENVLIGRYPHRRKWWDDGLADMALAEQALQAVGMEAFRCRMVNSLSGGEKRRLMLATLLAQNPMVYLMDEPTNHLDWRQKVRMLDLFRQLAKQQNKIIVMVMHDLPMIREYCDAVLALNFGGKYLLGSCRDICCESVLQKFYGDLW